MPDKPNDTTSNSKAQGSAGKTDPAARTRADQADDPSRGKAKTDGKANPTKPQQVHDENVNRA